MAQLAYGLAVLPLPAAGLIFWLAFLGQGHGSLQALLRAAVLWGALALGFSEALSLTDSLRFVPLWCLWTSACMAGLGCCYVKRPALAPLPEFDAETKIYIMLGLAVASITAAIAYASAPNTYDVLFYHLPRVEHWIQDRSLRLFPSHYDLQDFYPYGGEALVLQFRLLAGDDHLVNFPQWFAYLACGGTAYHLARGGDGERRSGLLAALVALALPAAMLQSGTADSDLTVAAWIMVAAALAREVGHASSLEPALWAALACGLALASKGTAYFYVFPLGLWILYELYLQRALGRTLGAGFLMAGLIVLPSLGLWWRNYHVCGDIFGSATDHFVLVHSLPSLVDQISSNLLLHVAFPFHQLNVWIYELFFRLHHFLGFSPYEPSLDWANSYPRIEDADAARRSHEDFIGNPIQLVLIGLAALPVMKAYGSSLKKTLAPLVCGLVGFVLYCFMVKWNPWGSRLHMAFFMLCAPWVGVAVSEWPHAWLRILLATGMVMTSVFSLLTMPARPVFGWYSIFKQPRITQNFRETGHSMEDFLAAAGETKRLGITQVGFHFDGFRPEYLFWQSFKEIGWLPQLECIDVKGDSAPLENEPPYRDFIPDAVIQYDIDRPMPWNGHWRGQDYSLLYTAGRLFYYVRKPFMEGAGKIPKLP